MSYVLPNFKTKEALKEAVAKGEDVIVFQPGPFGNNSTTVEKGEASIEGPHYPKLYRWHGRVEIENGLVVEVK